VGGEAGCTVQGRFQLKKLALGTIFGEPKYRFIAGLLLVPSLLFQENLYIKAFQVFLFILLSSLSGKRFRLLPNLMISTGIIFMNLLTPMGRVLFSLGGFYLTAGALGVGISKALMLIGLIYVSRFSVTRGLSLPGEFGGIIARVFYYFEELTARRGGLRKGKGRRAQKGHFFRLLFGKSGEGNIIKENLFNELDNLLFSVQETASVEDPAPPPGGSSDNPWLGRVFLTLLITLNWVLLFFRI